VLAIAALSVGCSRDPIDGAPQTFRLSVSEQGFTPTRIEASAGEPLTLLVTRTSESSCAKQIMIRQAGIQRELPVHQEVQITLAPQRQGELRYTCCDEMDGGRIVIR
jgi:plastocyanin domain-containing protein